MAVVVVAGACVIRKAPAAEAVGPSFAADAEVEASAGSAALQESAGVQEHLRATPPLL